MMTTRVFVPPTSIPIAIMRDSQALATLSARLRMKPVPGLSGAGRGADVVASPRTPFAFVRGSTSGGGPTTNDRNHAFPQLGARRTLLIRNAPPARIKPLKQGVVCERRKMMAALAGITELLDYC